jgi:hypothetical protein
MGASPLPTAKERRRVLAEGVAGLGQTGRELLAAGRWAEAQECLEAAQDSQGLRDLAAQAVEAGDFFAWRQACKALGQEPGGEDLARLAERAQAAGKLLHTQGARSLFKPQGERTRS